MMPTPITTPRAYAAALSATATANPWEYAQTNYGPLRLSQDLASRNAERDGLQRYDVGPGVPDDHMLRGIGCPCYETEREALGSMGDMDFPLLPTALSIATQPKFLLLAGAAALLYFGGRK